MRADPTAHISVPRWVGADRSSMFDAGRQNARNDRATARSRRSPPVSRSQTTVSGRPESPSHLRRLYCPTTWIRPSAIQPRRLYDGHRARRTRIGRRLPARAHMLAVARPAAAIHICGRYVDPLTPADLLISTMKLEWTGREFSLYTDMLVPY